MSRPLRSAPAALIGHSHTHCIAEAISDAGRSDILHYDLKRSGEALNALCYARPGPRTIFLLSNGNQHNLLTMINHPVAFHILPPGSTTKPSQSRHAIPYNVMGGVMTQMFERTRLVHDAVRGAFPNARIVVLAPPPPKGDWSFVERYPGPFSDKVGNGPTPDTTRKAVYDMQIDLIRKDAKRIGAVFLDVPSETLDTNGFLAADYSFGDPTHGNLEYGRAMLRLLTETMDATA